MLRTTLACLAVMGAASSVALADKKLQAIKPNFVKESIACKVEARGLARIVTGTTDYAATLSGTDKDAVDRDLAAVNATNTLVVQWCSELEGIVEFLTVNKDAVYKSVAKELDERYKRVAKLRKESKKSLVDLEPVTRRLIPKIKRPSVAAPEEKPAATAFPSGRKIVLPRLVGKWSVGGTGISDTATYSDKNMTATTTSRAFESGDCEQERSTVNAKATDGIADLEPPPAAKEIGVVWSVRLAMKDTPRALLVMCAPKNTGGVIVTSEVAPASNKVLAAEMTKLMVDMLAAQLAPPSAAAK